MASAASVASTGCAACVTYAAYVAAASITHFVSVEVIEGLISTRRMWTFVAVMWIEAVINVAAELVGAVEPRAGSDEHAVVEPLGPVVPVWGAGVWREVVEPIRANRLWPDIDGDPGGCRARDAQQSGNQSRKDKDFPVAHKFFSSFRKKQSRCQKL